MIRFRKTTIRRECAGASETIVSTDLKITGREKRNFLKHPAAVPVALLAFCLPRRAARDVRITGGSCHSGGGADLTVLPAARKTKRKQEWPVRRLTQKI